MLSIRSRANTNRRIIKRKCVLRLSCVFLLLLVAFNIDGKTLYYDDFDGTKGRWKALEWPKMETIKVEKEVGNPENMALTFDTRAVGGALADCLFIDGNEDMSDYTMKIRFRIMEETDKFAAAGIIVRAPHHNNTYVLKRPISGIAATKNHPITLLMFLV